MRIAVILVTEAAAVVLTAVWMPWLAIPVAAGGLVLASWQVQRWQACEAEVRRKESWVVGLLNGATLALLWLWVGVEDESIATQGWAVRLCLALCLGLGTTVATMGLSLIGRDLVAE